MIKTLRPTSRTAIIEAGFDVFNRDPSASLSVVAERAGVGRATLHRHFSSRAALLNTLALIALEEMDAAVETACSDAASYADAIERTLAALIPLGDRHGFLAHALFEADTKIHSAFARQQEATRDLVEKSKAEGLFDNNLPTAWISHAFDYLLYAAWDSVKAGDSTPKQAADLAWRTLTLGLGDTK